MKLLGLAYLAAFLGVSSANEQMKIMYYADPTCSSSVGEIDVTWADASETGANCYMRCFMEVRSVVMATLVDHVVTLPWRLEEPSLSC